MEFERGSEVFSSEGESIGRLRRVVIDPATKKVAALIVERGLLFTEEKLVPLTLVDRVEDDRVILSSSKAGLAELDRFEETHYVPRNE
jgi:sporulation protein YlmC with PRC-barrel domain